MLYIITFHSTNNAIKAEKTLLDAKLDIMVVPLPAIISAGCGICLQVSKAELDQALTLLAQHKIEHSEVYARQDAGNQISYELFATDHETKTPPVRTAAPDELPVLAEDSAKHYTVVISSDCMGQGSDELGRILSKSYLHALTGMEQLPDCIIFYNSGVRLVTAESNALEDLKTLAAAGVDILSCGTCLNFFQLEDKMAVGRVSNMSEICNKMISARHLVRI